MERMISFVAGALTIVVIWLGASVWAWQQERSDLVQFDEMALACPEIAKQVYAVNALEKEQARVFSVCAKAHGVPFRGEDWTFAQSIKARWQRQ